MGSRWPARVLDIQVFDVQGVFFDELAARFDDVAHQHGKNRIGFHVVFDLYLEHGSLLGVHGGLPKLGGGKACLKKFQRENRHNGYPSSSSRGVSSERLSVSGVHSSK